MRKIYSLLFLIVGILIFSACGNNNSQETIVYASNLNFKVSEIVKEIGDEIIIDNNLINLQPWRSKILEVTTTNSEIAEYNQLNNTVTCLKDGEATIIVTALGENENLQASVKLTVKPKIVYAQDLFFNNSEVEINYNEFNITNEVNVKLKNNCVVGFEEYCNTVNEYSVKYSRVGIVHYNPTTGLVSPLINDSKIEEVVVSLSVQNSLITTKTQSFKVRVTNYNYATDFQISNVTFNYNDDSLMFESNPITLINGDELVLPIVLTPANYNVEPTITTLTPNLTITNGVIRSNGVISDNEQVLVSLQVGKEQYIHKIVNVNVVMPNDFTIELLDKNYIVISDVFTNFTDYILKVNSHKNFSLNELQKVLNTEFIDFYSLEETNNNNEFLIVFTKANNLYEKIALKHSQDSFIRVNEIVSNEVNVNVYNAIENFNFSVKFNETTLVETDNNVFNLHLINETYRQLSIEEGVFYYANVKVLTELNTKRNNYTFYVLTSNGYVAINNLFETECATIKLQENGSYLILPTNAGELTIKVISNDNVAYEEILTFNIIEEKVTNILNSLTSNNTITLYLNSSNINYSDNFLLSSFESFPKYAFSGNLTFTSSNSEILNVNQAQGIASAVASGVCELIVINENFSKTYFVEVKEYSGYILIEYNGNSNLNNTTLTITKTLLQEACVVQFATYFNNEQLNGKLLKLEFLDENYNVVTSSNIINFFGLNGSRFSFTTLNYGVQKIKYSITHLELEIAGYIIVNVNNPYSNITSVSFESLETEFSVNLYFTNQFKNDLNILTDNENLPYLPEHLTVTSSSNNVLLDSVGNVTILYEQGYILQQEELVTITATALINNEFVSVSYVIKIFYEEPYANILSINFEKVETEFNVNLYYTNEFNNLLEIITDNSNLAYDESLISVTSNNENVVVDRQGNITILYEQSYALEQEELVTITATALINNEFVSVSYVINLFYEEPYANILSINFEKVETEFNVNLYYTNEFNNLLEIIIDNENLPYLSEHLTVTSSSNNVLVDRQGNITILYETGYALEQEELVTITATALINNEFVSVSYVINLFYEEPYANILSINFEKVETEFNVNLYYTNEFNNLLEIATDNDNLNYNSEDLTVTSSSNNVLVDSIGNVTILYEQGYILQQEELVTITATALINNEFISVSYVIKLFYEINYTKITSLELNTSYVNLNFEEDNFNHLVNELIIINHGNEGVYNFNELTILSNDTNFLAEITNNQLVVTINKINSGTIKIGLLSNEDINCILTIVVTSYTTISCESDLYKLNNASEEFVITKNFNVSKLFVSINNFNGKLHGNGYTISGFDVPMFNKLELMAEISNFTINTGKITSVGIGGKVTSLALENYGIISNVLINAEYDINHTTTFTLGGAVYSNLGIISNVKLNINAKSNNTTNSSVGLFAYENFNTIENCEVLSTSVITCFWLVSGFVYTNSFNANLNKDVYLNNCTTKFTFINNGSTYRFIPFIYRVQSEERVITINCKAYVVYNGTGSTTNYGFVASSSNSSYINCELFINYNNYSQITLPFVSSGSGNLISNAGNNIFTNVPFYF